MRQRPSREPLRRGPQFDSLETRAMMTHVPAAAFEAHLLKAGPAAEVRAAVPAVTTGTGGGSTPALVQNTYSIYDVNSNYIGGSIGLRAFVDGLYRNILHRKASTDEASFWTGTLASGRFAPYTVVSEFLTSPEAVKKGGSGEPLHPSNPPANIYTGYLGGPIGVKAFVDGLYIDVLHRAPDPAGEAAWIRQIEDHDLLPAKITFTFLAEQPGLR